ncbi:MAG TPA: M23 family metallopeptidase [Gemmatimonadaceae bacterium]|nr:M23 family metallopeptidase [Gemmatimonadaceae bacterium]
MIRFLLALLTIGCMVVQPVVAQAPDFRLQVVPGNVYKVDDPGGAGTSSFVFDLVVICSADCQLRPVSAHAELSSAGRLVERQDWATDMLAKIKQTRFRVDANTPLQSPTRSVSLPEAFDVRFYFRHPQALAIDSIAVAMTVADEKGRQREAVVGIPVRYYQQKTELIFPLRGRGIITTDYITNGGHRDFFTAFGLDIAGLNEKWGQLDTVPRFESHAGWGREVIAPASGTVVYARNDVPTAPYGHAPDSTYYKPLHDPVGAYVGNCVVIDHGNSEYSAMMHMQPGSITVKVGDRVTAGQVIGKLGSSGDASGPHLHYQLQSGPRPDQDPTLPVMFKNINGVLYQGRYWFAR